MVSADAAEIAAGVPDPELPMVTLADLGILRSVEQHADAVTVTITPTYSGCPAMSEIRQDLRYRLQQAGFHDIVLRTAISPPWTSDWITDTGRAKLAAAGIAAPQPTGPAASGPIPLTLTAPLLHLRCPLCGSHNTAETSAFSGTACKALYRCSQCQEPFESFKEI